MGTTISNTGTHIRWIKSTKKRDKKRIRELSELTNFSEQEIHHWFEGFLKDCPTGKLTKTEFAKIYRGFFPKGDATAFSAFVFNVFDDNGDGWIEFHEFLQALSITTRGKPEEKLEWAFRLYDLDHNGSISKDEMLQIVTVIFQMVGHRPKSYEDSPEARVERIFELMDDDGNGELTKEEFINGAGKDSSIVGALSMYQGAI